MKCLGGNTLQAWGTICWISLLQDLTAIEFFTIYVYYIVGINSLRKQITDIHRVLKTTLSQLIRDGSIHDSNTKESKNIRVCQHVLGSCRAAYSHELKDLPSARLLRELDDDDVATVKQTKNKKFAVYWGVLLSIPAMLASISDFMSDLIKKCIPALFVGGFLLANAVLADISIYAVTIPYAVLITVYAYLYLVFYPARNRLMVSFTTGIPYANNNLHNFDRIIVFFSYDGIKKGLCRNTSTNKSFTTLFGNSIFYNDDSDDDNNINEMKANESAQAAADATNAQETQSTWQLILTQVNSLQQRLQTFRREVPQQRNQRKLAEGVDFEY